MKLDEMKGTASRKLLRLPQVLDLIPIGKSSWWAGVSKGIYPEPVRLASRTTAWKAQDIYDFIDRLSGEAPSNQIFSAPTSGC